MTKTQKDILRRVLARLNAQGIPLNKITIQKILYFLRETGLPVGYRYEAWTYGPFSSSLANTLNEMVILGEISEENYTYTIEETKEQSLEKDTLEKIDAAVDNFIGMVNGKFDFDTMELVGTVIYCHSSLRSIGEIPTNEKILVEFVEWKGDRYSQKQILDTYNSVKNYLQ